MKVSNSRPDNDRYPNGSISLSKGMQRLLIVIFVMFCGLVVALKWVDGTNSLLLCVDKRISPVYEGLLPSSSALEEKGGTENSRKALEDTRGGNSTLKEKLIENGDSLKTDCDYSEGNWVKDESRPRYSGKTCKQWLSGMWACRLMNRPDFTYEHYRWQPLACDLPEFDGPTFLSRMQHKVLAFVGDSIGRQQYQSMMCMITGGKEDFIVEDVGSHFGLSKPRGAIRPDGIAHRFKAFNTTVIYYWSASLCEIVPLNKTDPNTEFAMHLDRPATFLQKHIDRFDILVLNTGHHWNRGKLKLNKWVMHVDGKPNTDASLNDVKVAYNFTVHKVISWLDKKLEANHTKAQVYMRSLSPRHFFNGEWDSGGRCDDNRLPVERKNITGQMTRDPVAESAVLGTRVHLLNVTYLSQFRDEAHISKYRSNGGGQDCLHWCLPGIPDVWNEVLYASLLYGHGSKQKLKGRDEIFL